MVESKLNTAGESSLGLVEAMFYTVGLNLNSITVWTPFASDLFVFQ